MVTAASGPRVILVTGAARGIGLAVVEGLAAQGHRVLLGAGDAERERVAAAALAGDVHPIVIDVTDPSTIDAASVQVEAAYERLDSLVNKCGQQRRLGAAAQPDVARRNPRRLRH
ncbi:MAG TPA: SDR family NAD(P)-dependent oxidoreductase [Acidimicrobiales bacterium]|nr:SDR family NAD(P)-dependent oxidoreductase [Acidimicrobiales bacterium]